MSTWRATSPHAHDHEPHAMYKVIGIYDRVIYIGISHDPAERVRIHRTTADWRREIVRWEIAGWYPDVFAARIAERAAIRAEDPDHNFHHTEDALQVVRTPLSERRQKNEHVRLARSQRMATRRLDAAIRRSA